MAERGARVLVLEREKQFRDRVRGEQMSSWGVAEARELGIYELLRDACAHEVRLWQTHLGDSAPQHRDCIAESVQHHPQLAFYHPGMQEVLLQAAADAGAEVRRGVAVRDVKPGTPASVIVEEDGRGQGIPRASCRRRGRTSVTSS
jgi:menaquinone-9 beta-reductase